MEQKEVFAQLDEYRTSILSKYPRQQLLTVSVFKTIIEMMIVDYSSVSPGGKRIDIFKKYMLSWISQTLENDGCKNYNLDLINVFKNNIIFSHLNNSFGNKSKDVNKIIQCAYYEIFAWQGLEGCESKRIKRIEKRFRNIK